MFICIEVFPVIYQWVFLFTIIAAAIHTLFVLKVRHVFLCNIQWCLSNVKWSAKRKFFSPIMNVIKEIRKLFF